MLAYLKVSGGAAWTETRGPGDGCSVTQLVWPCWISPTGMDGLDWFAFSDERSLPDAGHDPLWWKLSYWF